MELVDWLRATGTTKLDLARLLGVSQTSAARYAAGTPPKNKAVARCIFDITGGNVTPNDLYGIGPRTRTLRRNASGRE